MLPFDESDNAVQAFQLKLDNLVCERDERVLFSGLSALYGAGEIVQLVGPNGAGKTTLLRIICGLSSNYSGSVTCYGEPNTGYAFRSSLLYLGHAPAVNTSLSPMENLMWYFALHGLKADSDNKPLSQGGLRQKLVKALAQTGMSGYENVPCGQMSAGQQRRVALARIFCSAAPLWVLDEPYTSIDRDGVKALEQRFEQHAKAGGMVLLTSHQELKLQNVTTLDLSHFRGGEK